MKKTLTIAPLSTPQTLTISAWKAIEGASRLFLQTAEHPSARPVLEAGLSYVSMDDLYAAFQAVLRDAFFSEADGGLLDF